MQIDRGKTTLLAIVLSMTFAFMASVPAQEVVDKTVATVSDGTRSPQLITYSDILWQIALQPRSDLPPQSADLDQALQTLINQRIFALEAERLPRSAPTDKEIAAKISDILAFFPSPAAFERRLKQVGFDSVRDESFERLIAQRVAIDKYVDFRFGSFVVVTSEEEAKYYQDTFAPDFRRRTPGILVPTLDEKRVEIHEILVRQKIASAIERFLDDAKRRLDIEILIDV